MKVWERVGKCHPCQHIHPLNGILLLSVSIVLYERVKRIICIIRNEKYQNAVGNSITFVRAHYHNEILD